MFVAFLKGAGESLPRTLCSCFLDLLNRCPSPGYSRGGKMKEDEVGRRRWAGTDKEFSDWTS